MLLNCGVGEDSWTARRSTQSILKEISPEYSLEGLMLKLKLQYFGPLMRRADSLEKTLMLRKNRRQEEKGTKDDDMFRWYHWLNGPKSVQSLGDGKGQRSLVCCSPWGHKELDRPEQLDNHKGEEWEHQRVRQWKVCWRNWLDFPVKLNNFFCLKLEK